MLWYTRNHNGIYKMDPATGNTVATFAAPGAYDLAFDGSGKLWYTSDTNTIREIDPVSGNQIVSYNTGVVDYLTFDSAGILWYTRSQNGIWKMDPATGNTVGTFAAPGAYDLAFQVPEPGTISLMLTGLLLGLHRRRNRLN